MHIYFLLTTLAYGAEGLHFSAFIQLGDTHWQTMTDDKSSLLLLGKKRRGT